MQLKPGEKSVDLMVDLVSMVSKEGKLVLKTYAASLPTAKTFLKLPKRRTFKGCENSSSCL